VPAVLLFRNMARQAAWNAPRRIDPPGRLIHQPAARNAAWTVLGPFLPLLAANSP